MGTTHYQSSVIVIGVFSEDVGRLRKYEAHHISDGVSRLRQYGAYHISNGVRNFRQYEAPHISEASTRICGYISSSLK
jgi:hypothetical protein